MKSYMSALHEPFSSVNSCYTDYPVNLLAVASCLVCLVLLYRQAWAAVINLHKYSKLWPEVGDCICVFYL